MLLYLAFITLFTFSNSNHFCKSPVPAGVTETAPYCPNSSFGLDYCLFSRSAALDPCKSSFSPGEHFQARDYEVWVGVCFIPGVSSIAHVSFVEELVGCGYCLSIVIHIRGRSGDGS